LTDLSRIRNNITNKYKNVSLENLILALKNINLDIEYYSTDVKYQYKEKSNKFIERKQKIIIFGLKNKLNYLDANKTAEFFFDATYKIIPKHFRPYKLIVISGLIEETQTPHFICFCLLKYLDKESYNILFDYMHNNFNFTPKILHSDFDKALYEAIKNNIYFGKTVIHSKCLFHFAQSLRNKLSRIGFTSKKLNKISIEIIRNVELLCFIKKINIQTYKDLILNKLKDNQKLKLFVNYLQNYVFKLNPSVYNYEELINIKKSDDDTDNIFLQKFYSTNNIVESINSKINFYLPKTSTNNKNFLDSISKIIINNTFEKKEIIRRDFVTRSLFFLIDELDLNNKPKWITYDEYKNALKKIINKYESNYNEEEVNNYIKMINDQEDKGESDNLSNNNIKIDNNINKEEDISNNMDLDFSFNVDNEDNDKVKEEEYYNSSEEIIEEDDNSISKMFKNLNINKSKDDENFVEGNNINDHNVININNNNNSYFNLPLKNRIEIRENNLNVKHVNISKNLNNASKNMISKDYKEYPKKRKYIYPKDYSDEEIDSDIEDKNRKKTKNKTKYKKLGWK